MKYLKPWVMMMATVLDQDQMAWAKRIVLSCVGDSITEDGGASGSSKAYPGLLRTWLEEEDVEVKNYGRSGSTMMDAGSKWYQDQDEFEDAKKSDPDVVTIMLGTNDAKGDIWGDEVEDPEDEYVETYVDFVRTFRELDTAPEIVVMIPVPHLEESDKWPDEDVINEIIPELVEEVAEKTGAYLVDMRRAFDDVEKDDLDDYYKDPIHPNDDGNLLMAEYLLGQLQKFGLLDGSNNPPTYAPTRFPTSAPTRRPTYSPTRAPVTEEPTTLMPTPKPITPRPTPKPTTPRPTGHPTLRPTYAPTLSPSSPPTDDPDGPTRAPTRPWFRRVTPAPIFVPTHAPSSMPITPTPTPTPPKPTTAGAAPSDAVFDLTPLPTPKPTSKPTTAAPTPKPTTAAPTPKPTPEPTTAAPSPSPTVPPTRSPSPSPSRSPTTSRSPTNPAPTAAATTLSPAAAPIPVVVVDNPEPDPTPAPTAPPSTARPTTPTPTSPAPTTSTPTSPPPTTSVPTTSVPTTSVPTTSVPTTSMPTTSMPTTSPPTSIAPTTTQHTVEGTLVLVTGLSASEFNSDPSAKEAFATSVAAVTSAVRVVNPVARARRRLQAGAQSLVIDFEAVLETGTSLDLEQAVEDGSLAAELASTRTFADLVQVRTTDAPEERSSKKKKSSSAGVLVPLIVALVIVLALICCLPCVARKFGYCRAAELRRYDTNSNADRFKPSQSNSFIVEHKDDQCNEPLANKSALPDHEDASAVDMSASEHSSSSSPSNDDNNVHLQIHSP